MQKFPAIVEDATATNIDSTGNVILKKWLALDKKTFRSGLDWELILFFGSVNSLAAVALHLKIDRWLVQQMTPVLSSFSFHSMASLLVIVAIVYVTRIFLRKMPAAIVLTVVLIPWAPRIGVHPGILLITMS